MADRELDALVAKQIFGLKVEERTNLRTGQRDYLHAVGSNPAEPGWVRLPEFSASPTPNLNLEGWLRHLNWTRIAPTGKAPRLLDVPHNQRLKLSDISEPEGSETAPMLRA